MQIPHTQLPIKTLEAVVHEFVTRDGTDHTSVNRRVEDVMQLLEDGCVELHFDDETKTCNILKNPD